MPRPAPTYALTATEFNEVDLAQVSLLAPKLIL